MGGGGGLVFLSLGTASVRAFRVNFSAFGNQVPQALQSLLLLILLPLSKPLLLPLPLQLLLQGQDAQAGPSFLKTFGCCKMLAQCSIR
jgi:hypothetical protein